MEPRNSHLIIIDGIYKLTILRQYSTCFTYIHAFNSHNNTEMWLPFSDDTNEAQRLGDTPKPAEQVGGRAVNYIVWLLVSAILITLIYCFSC